MPSMPSENLWNEIGKLINLEQKIGLRQQFDIDAIQLPDYWKQLAYLLAFYHYQMVVMISMR